MTPTASDLFTELASLRAIEGKVNDIRNSLYDDGKNRFAGLFKVFGSSADSAIRCDYARLCVSLQDALRVAVGMPKNLRVNCYATLGNGRIETQLDDRRVRVYNLDQQGFNLAVASILENL